ncbi:MAG: response regulator transcription factor [Chloroflexi bacterium]|nr:response regulator transcription factor [Chloroflexota bacterium]
MVNAINSQARPGTDEAPASARSTGDPIKVFLIEDHQIVREGTRRLLELDGDIKVVGESDNGEDAVESPGLAMAEVVLCDMMLPGIDGIETTRRIVSRHPRLRVVILSSFGEGYVLSALEAGAAGYLLKRTDQEELARAVRVAAAGGSPLSGSLNAMLVARFREMRGGGHRPTLTERQRDVLKMVAHGETTQAIAAARFMSPATVKRELRNAFDKLGVNNRAHAVAEAQQRGLI